MRILPMWSVATLLAVGCAQAHEQDALPEVSESAITVLGFGVSGHGCRHLPPPGRELMWAAGERIADLQADQLGDNAHNGLDDSDPDDGGWDWNLPADADSHSDQASPTNTYGSVALGPWAALRAGVRTHRGYTLLLDAGYGLQRAVTGDSTGDLVFLTLLGGTTDNPGFAALARQRYTAQLEAAGGAAQLATQQRDKRHAAQHDGLIAYDLAWLTLAASALDWAYPGAGFAADARTYVELLHSWLTQAQPYFDPNDPDEGFYTHGLAWSLVALARAPAAWPEFVAIRAHLLQTQHENGAWGWNASYPDDNLQATAHALTALALTSSNDRPARAALLRGARWLLQQQDPSGGFVNVAGIENPQVDAEIMLAFYVLQCSPGSGPLGLEKTSAAPTARDAKLSLSKAASAQPPLAMPHGH